MGTEQKILDLPARPRLLVICVARFGDTLLITPTLAALKQRWPQAQLTVLAHPARREILENLPFIDRLDTITKQRAPWCGRLPGRPYDAAIVYGDDLHLFAYARRVAWAVVGFAGNEAVRRASLTHAVPRPVGPTPAAFERTLLLLPFGLPRPPLPAVKRCSADAGRSPAGQTATAGASARMRPASVRRGAARRGSGWLAERPRSRRIRQPPRQRAGRRQTSAGRRRRRWPHRTAGRAIVRTTALAAW